MEFLAEADSSAESLRALGFSQSTIRALVDEAEVRGLDADISEGSQ